MNVIQLDADTDFLAGTTSASYSPTSKRRNQNIAYQDVARLIWTSAEGWQYDDSNATTLAYAVTNLLANQQDYALPSTVQRLHRVEVKDGQGNYQRLKQVDIHDIDKAMSEYYETAGRPLYYDVMGRSLLLYPKPSSTDVTLTDGLKIWVDRNITELAVSATTTEPGFASPFHRILSYAAAIDVVQDDKQRQFLLIQKARLEKALVQFYSKRNIERSSSIRPDQRKRWRKFI